MTIGFDLTITVGVIVTVVIAVIGWSKARWSALDKRHADLSDRLDRHDSRITAAEQTLKGMPAKDDVHAIRIELTEMRGDLRAMKASMDGQQAILTRVESVVDRQENHLMGRRT